MAQMKEQLKAPEKIQLSDKEIANLSDAQFKTLVIKMLTKIVKYDHKIDEEVKAMKSERKMYRKPTVTGRKMGLKSMIWSTGKK